MEFKGLGFPPAEAEIASASPAPGRRPSTTPLPADLRAVLDTIRQRGFARS
jgi:hypothetical protein